MSETRYRSGPEGYRTETEGYRSKSEGYRSKPKKNRMKPMILGAGIAILAVTIVFATVFIPPYFANETASAPAASASNYVSQAPATASPQPSVTSTPSHIKQLPPPAAVPLIYENSDQVFLASGGNRISLTASEDLYAGYNTANSMFSGDKRYLYYISGLDISTGEGTLSAVRADGVSSPEEVAEGVCSANVSYDGKKVMYISNINGTAGTLYLKSAKGVEEVAQNVVPFYYVFSYDGEYISYLVQENREVFAMYLKKTGRAPELVTRITASAVTDGGVSVTRFSETVLLASGQVLYSIEENYNMPLYLYNCGGGTQRLCNDGYIVKIFASGGFLYAETGQEKTPLWYKAPGEEPVRVSENYDHIIFMKDWPASESRFLLAEHIGEGADNPGVMMYEAEPGGERKAISLADEGFEINSSFDCVAYQRDGKLYAARKTEAGWKETYLCDATMMELGGVPSSGIIARFDGSGENLYFFDEFKASPLYRYSVKDGAAVKIVDSVDWFCVTGDIPFAHTTNDKLYRGAQRPKMILQGVRELIETEGGAYLLTEDGKVCFIAEGEDSIRILDSFSKTAALDGLIRYYPPVEQDARGAITVLSGEVNYCLYKLGVLRDKYSETLGIDKASSLTTKLLKKEDLGAAQGTVLEKMKAGFEAYSQWTRGKAKRSYAAAALEEAAESCAQYLSGAGVPDNQ